MIVEPRKSLSCRNKTPRKSHIVTVTHEPPRCASRLRKFRDCKTRVLQNSKQRATPRRYNHLVSRPFLSPSDERKYRYWHVASPGVSELRGSRMSLVKRTLIGEDISIFTSFRLSPSKVGGRGYPTRTTKFVI